MNEMIAHSGTITMTSLELVDFINASRAQAEALLSHANFLAKVPKVLGETSHSFECDLPDSYGRPRKGYRFPKREACLMAMSYSYDLQAKVFDRMTALEEQAKLRPQPLPYKLAGEIAIMECYTRLLRPSPSSQVAMLGKIAEQNGMDSGFLPAYVVDAAPDAAGGSSMPTAPITQLLKDKGIAVRPHAYNELLINAGMLERRTRKSTSKRAVNGEKQFLCITERGLRYGKNVTSPESPRETQPHWYVERFEELHRVVTGRLVSNATEVRRYGNDLAPNRAAATVPPSTTQPR